jgi:glycosyltransferase involved in cell wall biosynthesis
MNIVHLLASPFVGGPERQVLGLARAMSPRHASTFLSFVERGLARPFLERARVDGFEAHELAGNFPYVWSTIDEVAGWLKRLRAEALLTSGYKPDLIGWRAARVVGIPVIGIAHGWTGVTLKVQFYEWLDAFCLRYMDACVCVSEAMAQRAIGRWVPAKKVVVIRNAIDAAPYDVPPSGPAETVRGYFPTPPRLVVGAAGRLSPEKGFDVLIDAAAVVCRSHTDVGFLIFGSGPQEDELRQRIAKLGLEGRVVLGGFRSDLERVLPGFDIGALSSHTEGLPVAVLEAQAAGLPVVATAVGGTPEVLEDGRTGLLVPPARPDLLASRLTELIDGPQRRREMGEAGRRRVRDEFTFAAQAERYEQLLQRLVHPARRKKEGARVTC